MRARTSLMRLMVVVISVASCFLAPMREAQAHCDTMSGPVVKDARNALATGDVTPVLKWVRREYEDKIRRAFQQALMARRKDPARQEQIDLHFFETTVRLHRLGEGAPYTGLKPAAADLEPAIAAADKALEGGSVGAVVSLVTDEAAHGIRERFARALEKKQHASDSVEAGREFVEAYVAFLHYVERLAQDATSQEALHEGR